MFSFFMRNIWQIFNVVTCRYLQKPPKYLPAMVMFITGQCNLRCRMCGVCELESGHSPEEELTTEQWKAVIHSAAKELGTSLAAISGGEPLLRPDICEIIRYATEQGIAVHLCTNGVLFDTTSVQQLRDSGVASVSISLESPDSMIHDYLRGDNTFPVVIEAIQKFHEIAPDIRIGINYLITSRNYKNMIDMVKFARSLNVHQIKFAPIHTNLLHRKKPLEKFDDLLFSEAELTDLEHEVALLKEACKRNGLITTSDAFLDGIANYYRNPDVFTCYAGYAVCAISPTGNVAPCCDKESILNVKEKPLHEIWRSPEFHQLRNQVHACSVPCWDTTYTELSLLLNPLFLVRNVFHNLRNLKFYFTRNKINKSS